MATYLSDLGADLSSISLDDLAGEITKRGKQLWYGGFSWPGGVPANAQRMGDHVFGCGVTIPPDFSPYAGHSSQASGSANATSSTVFKVQKNGSDVGTITIASGSVTPTFSTSGAAVVFAKGDKLTILAPATADATFANPCFTLIGYKS